MAKDILDGLSPELQEEMQEMMNRVVTNGKVTQKQIRESGKMLRGTSRVQVGYK